jgi:hypothetical protein
MPERVRISDPEAGQQTGFQGFHPVRLANPFMVIALGMQHAMDDQMGQMISQSFSLRPCLGADDGQAQHDVSLHRLPAVGKGQNIGGVVFAAPGQIECSPFASTHQPQGDLRFGLEGGPHPAAQLRAINRPVARCIAGLDRKRKAKLR